MPRTTQLTVSLKSRPGVLAQLARTLADARINIEQCRLLTLKAAYMMDTAGNKAAQGEIAMIKVAGPKVALKVVDDAIQAFGGAGVSSDAGLARMYASLRTMRIVPPFWTTTRTPGTL